MAFVHCTCGCGETFDEFSSTTGKPRKQPRRFILGHSNNNKLLRDKEKPDALRGSKSITARRRARPQVGCQLVAIGGCLGRLEVHHLDGDWGNNEPTNLLKLCSTHHKLVEAGRVDLANPVMPAFYMQGSRRRYLEPGETQEENVRKRSSRVAVSDGNGSPGKLTAIQAGEVWIAYGDGTTQAVLAERFGVSITYINRLLRTHPEYQPAGPGENSPRAALTMEQVRAIREAHATRDVTQKELAREYGVSQGCIGRIIRGERYRDA